MITIKAIIDDIKAFQRGQLPQNAIRLNTPNSTDETLKKSFPIAAVLVLVLNVAMFIKIITNRTIVVAPAAIVGGFLIGFILLIAHELLHAIVYPRKAEITIGKIKKKFVFVALASYPMSRQRFILMCLLPFVLGIIPLAIFILSPAENTILNGFMFGIASIGMVSPYPDVYNVIIVLNQTKKYDKIMFYENDLYRIPR